MVRVLSVDGSQFQMMTKFNMSTLAWISRHNLRELAENNSQRKVLLENDFHVETENCVQYERGQKWKLGKIVQLIISLFGHFLAKTETASNTKSGQQFFDAKNGAKKICANPPPLPFLSKKVYCYTALHNNPSYSRILVGFCL